MFWLKDPFKVFFSLSIEVCHISGFFFSQFYFLSFVIIWVLKFCHNLSFVTLSFSFFFTIRVLSQFEFCHKFTCVTIWVLSQFEFCHNLNFVIIWGFVNIWVFDFFHNLSLVTTWILSYFEFCQNLSFFTFATIWFFFYLVYLFFFLSQFEFLSFIKIWVFKFHHNLRFIRNLDFEFHHNLSWVLSQFEFEFFGEYFCW